MTNRQKWTKRILISSLALVLLAIGTSALVLGLMPVTYHLNLNSANIKDITINTGSETTVLRFDDRQNGFISNANAKDEILRLLARGGRTNELSNVFRSVSENNTVRRYPTNTHTIARTNFIQIAFDTTQFAVTGNHTAGWRLVELNRPGIQNPASTTHVRQIFIPLESLTQGFGESNWFLSTAEDGQTFVEFQLTTHGNFRYLTQFLYENF